VQIGKCQFLANVERVVPLSAHFKRSSRSLFPLTEFGDAARHHLE
jgi:hypothetical protein